MEPFDLIEHQERARQTCDPKKLFQMWEDVCRRYEHKEIGFNELEEMKSVIWPGLSALTTLRRMVNATPAAQKEKPRQRKSSA